MDDRGRRLARPAGQKAEIGGARQQQRLGMSGPERQSSPSERGDWNVPNDAEPVRTGAAAVGSIGSPAILVIASTIGR